MHVHNRITQSDLEKHYENGPSLSLCHQKRLKIYLCCMLSLDLGMLLMGFFHAFLVTGKTEDITMLCVRLCNEDMSAFDFVVVLFFK